MLEDLRVIVKDKGNMKIGNKGFTLTELLVSLALLGIILPSVSVVFYAGYKSYYDQRDIIVAQQKAKEIMEMIITDLRVYENSNITVDLSGNKLVIELEEGLGKDSIIYWFNPDEKNIYKSNQPIINDNEEIEIINFVVEEISELGFDTSLINISIFVKAGKSEEVYLNTNYRRKIKAWGIEP
ncbi:UNVERIFIED_CONTAM: prepilin-type N-terminal cleavage/methylation domain-containing protein [Acetivibrio alkalicellulosi]